MPGVALTAPRQLNTAAPGNSALPATTPTTPPVYLSEDGPGVTGATSKGSNTANSSGNASGKGSPDTAREANSIMVSPSSPSSDIASSSSARLCWPRRMSASSWVPQAGWRTWARRQPPKVMVASAVMCSSPAKPVSASTPDGRSTASVGSSATSSTISRRDSSRLGRAERPVIASISRLYSQGLSSAEMTRPSAATNASRAGWCARPAVSSASTGWPPAASVAPA